MNFPPDCIELRLQMEKKKQEYTVWLKMNTLVHTIITGLLYDKQIFI